jgi:hypothetical protein
MSKDTTNELKGFKTAIIFILFIITAAFTGLAWNVAVDDALIKMKRMKSTQNSNYSTSNTTSSTIGGRKRRY